MTGADSTSTSSESEGAVGLPAGLSADPNLATPGSFRFLQSLVGRGSLRYWAWGLLIVLMLLPMARWWGLYAVQRYYFRGRSWFAFSAIGNFARGTALSLACGQGTLIAAAIGWGRGSVIVRSAIGLCALLGLALLEGVSLFACEQVHDARDELDLVNCLSTVLSCSVFLLVLHVLPMLGQVGMARAYGIEMVEGTNPSKGSNKWQISLLDMMALTMMVSLVLALVRWLASDLLLLFPKGEVDWDSIRKLGILMFGNLFMLNAMITCFHVRRPWWLNLMLVYFIAILVTAIQSFSLWWFEPVRSWHDAVTLSVFCLMTNFGHLTFVLFAWWVLRGLGYQLERREKTEPQAVSA